MLKELRIKNLAIVDDLNVHFDRGFNVLTGETGAGKSIIVDSLSVALGSKPPPDFIRSGEKEALVQAYFELDDAGQLPGIGVDMTEGVILRRSFFSSGKSRAYINDTMVSIQSLADVGRALVDIHGQHEHQSLLSTDRHRLFLDLFGGLQDEHSRVDSLYWQVEKLKAQLSALRNKARERSVRLDLLKFQISEIDAADLKPGEMERLNEQKAILSHCGKLRELSEGAYEVLYASDDSCIAKLSLLIKKLREMSLIDHRAVDVLKSLETSLPLLDDAAISLRAFRERYEFEPGSLDKVEERLATIRRLEKKYGEGVEEIIRYRDGARAEMESLVFVDEQIAATETELSTKEAMLTQAAAALSRKRREAALQMEKRISQELKELAFGDSAFHIDVREEAISHHGIDRIEFLFSPNAGEPAKPLAKIASGGELSRVMLALKTVFADIDGIPVLIFDEIDSGIGGKTAEIVARKLKNLSRKHQVLCATHLPQLASKGDIHLRVEKTLRDDRVRVVIKRVTGSERTSEIARMLSGAITESSLRHAKELIESVAFT